MLMLLALEKLFDLGEQKSFRVFFWLYNIGLIITVGMQTTLGIMTVLDHGVKPEIPMLSGISGLGHMLLTAALIALFTALGKRIKLEPHLPSSRPATAAHLDRKSTRLNSSHVAMSYAVFCLKKKKK